MGKFLEVLLICQILSPSLGQDGTESKVENHQRVSHQSNQASAPVFLKPPQAQSFQPQITQPQELQGSVVTLGNEPPPDFSKAELQSDGSHCITKSQPTWKMEKQTIKECWHQNVSVCHSNWETSFKSVMVEKCDDNTFWKTCKISFHSTAINYTVRSCHTPLVQQCSSPQDTDAKPEIVCKTWYETYCNTTMVKEDADGNNQARPHTWCDKVPKEICAPDYCQMIPGNQDCQEVTIQSTQVAPKEMCDLQPTSDCHMETNMVPFLVSVQNCADVPKEFCHMRMGEPKRVKKYVNMRWCWRGAEPTEWYRNKDGLPETSDDLKHGFNTDILPRDNKILRADDGVDFRSVSPSSSPSSSVEGLDGQLNLAIPILDADPTSGRAEANPNPFASNLLQDPAIVESTPDWLAIPAIQPTDQTLTLGVNSTVNNK